MRSRGCRFGSATKNLANLKKPLAINSKINYNPHMFIPYNTPSDLVKLILEGKSVRYLADKSSQTKDGVRIFKVEEVEHIGFGAKSGKRYITAKVRDIDDKAESKSRNLHFAGIDLVF